MHIPDSMLHGTVCPVTAAVAVAGVGAAAVAAFLAKEKPSTTHMGAVAAFIFAAQMLNFPVQGGTSGHLLGATLAGALLGTPFAVLVMTLVLAVQAVVFADGGLTVLGANVLNMALAGTVAGGLVRTFAAKKASPRALTAWYAGAAWLSVVAAATACSLELAAAGVIDLAEVFGPMVSVHALIGLGEAAITAAAYHLLSSNTVTMESDRQPGLLLGSAFLLALVASPFASGLPDGLEWVAGQYRFLHESAPRFVQLLPDYSIPGMGNEALSTGLAGVIGVAATFALSWVVARVLRRTAAA